MIRVHVAGNGFIEGKELDQFLYELVTSVNTRDLGPGVSLLHRRVVVVGGGGGGGGGGCLLP